MSVYPGLVLHLALSRLFLAYATWPDLSGWFLTLGTLLLFALLALGVLMLWGGLELRPLRLPWQRALLLVGAAFVSPALLEESLYRALLTPHPLEPVPERVRLAWAAFSLALYVFAHPLVAWRWPWARAYFWRPAFLIVVTLLGLVCTGLYLRTGSLWPPTLVHGLTVAAWKLAFGGPERPFAGLPR